MYCTVGVRYKVQEGARYTVQEGAGYKVKEEARYKVQEGVFHKVQSPKQPVPYNGPPLYNFEVYSNIIVLNLQIKSVEKISENFSDDQKFFSDFGG